MKQLPSVGTTERWEIEDEAIEIGLDALRRTEGKVAEALYEVYDTMRQKFVAEGYEHAAHAARLIESYVSASWTRTILRLYEQ